MVVGGASGSWIWGGENVSVVANLHRATIVTISSRLDQEQRLGRHYCGRGLMACQLDMLLSIWASTLPVIIYNDEKEKLGIRVSMK